jgi:hypothetical protein
MKGIESGPKSDVWIVSLLWTAAGSITAPFGFPAPPPVPDGVAAAACTGAIARKITRARIPQGTRAPPRACVRDRDTTCMKILINRAIVEDWLVEEFREN